MLPLMMSASSCPAVSLTVGAGESFILIRLLVPAVSWEEEKGRRKLEGKRRGQGTIGRCGIESFD